MKINKKDQSRFFGENLPRNLDIGVIISARQAVGSGYEDDYYASVASEFIWLYRAGYEDGKATRKKKSK